jgi:hypothetical protein
MSNSSAKKRAALVAAKTPNPVTMYNEISESGGIHRSAAYMAKYDAVSDARRHELYASNLDIIHFVKDMFDPSKKYSRDEASQFLKAYNAVIHIKKHGIWHMKRLLLQVTAPEAKTSRRGWNIHYQIEQSVDELMRMETTFGDLVRGAQYLQRNQRNRK